MRMIEFFSKIWWRVQNDMEDSSFRRLKSDGHLDFLFADANRHPEIIGHDQRADQEQPAAGGADDVEGECIASTVSMKEYSRKPSEV
ncbi:hypothetical protein ACVWXM_000850 [Bradyrhizobium sp. GM7.3]